MPEQTTLQGTTSGLRRGDVALDQPDYGPAMDAAMRLLAVRDRTGTQLHERLTASGVDRTTAAAVVARLRDLELVDDHAFARRWVDRRAARKGLSSARLTDELVAEGVDRETAEEVVAGAGLDDAARAHTLAVELAVKHGRLAPDRQAARIQAALARRGFSEEVVEEALRAVLPPEGWD